MKARARRQQDSVSPAIYGVRMAIREMPPRGRYGASEVGRLAGVSGTTIGQWARRAYIRSSQDDGPPRIYSYQDIAEAMVVHALLDRGLKHKAIRQTIAWLRDQRGHAWPLTHAEQLMVPADYTTARRGRSVVAADGTCLIDATTGDAVLPESDLVEIAEDLRRGGWAARKLQLRHIEVDPDRLSGRPVIAGTRVPAEDAARLASAPDGHQILREEYGLTTPQIDDAVKWWKAVTGYEPAA